MTEYKSAFTMENPPLLVAWVSFQFAEQVEQSVIAGLVAFLTAECSFSQHEKDQAPHVVWAESRPEVLKTFDVLTTEDRRQLVGLSGRELYHASTEYGNFQATLDLLDRVVGKFDPGTEVVQLSLHFYNVFETAGLTTNLVLENLQGPAPQSANAVERRQFEFSRALASGWEAATVEYLPGTKYRPRIRNGIEQFLVFNPQFKADQSTHCYKVDLSVSKSIKMPIGDCLSALVDSRMTINQLFLSLITDEAHKEWKITKH